MVKMFQTKSLFRFEFRQKCNFIIRAPPVGNFFHLPNFLKFPFRLDLLMHTISWGFLTHSHTLSLPLCLICHFFNILFHFFASLRFLNSAFCCVTLVSRPSHITIARLWVRAPSLSCSRQINRVKNVKQFFLQNAILGLVFVFFGFL